ncbi:MAG: DUF3866 family protein [Solirubrobacterales bacterium]
MLKLRKGTVVATSPLEVELGGERRMAWADPVLAGACEPGDEVIVNTEALDLGLGSGGFDIVLVNLTRGLEGPGAEGPHVMKLNYSALQHPVGTVEREVSADPPEAVQDRIPVLVIGLHGQLAPAAWAFARKASEEGKGGAILGYVQTQGGALPGALSRDVKALMEDGLLAGHVTAGPTWGGTGEAITTIGALDAAGSLGWDAVVAGPGPGILGSGTPYGHGGMAALDTAHAGLSLGAPTVLAPRLSGSDPRPRHRGLSHHSRTVLSHLLGGIDLPLPEGSEELSDVVRDLGRGKHRVTIEPVDLSSFESSEFVTRTMGRGPSDDPEFFAGALAGGSRLASLLPA